MNKKAQIATALLVMIALGFSGAALYAIVTFKNDINFQSSEFDTITKHLDFIQNYILSQSKLFGKEIVTTCKDCSEEQIKQKGKEFDAKHHARTEEEGNFFAKLRNGEFQFAKEGDLYRLEIKDLFVQTSSGSTKLTRNFNICQTFNETGDYSDDC